MMKKLLFILLSIGMLFSCNKEDESSTDLIGDWKLIEILADPGDGSGTFQPVESDKTIKFKADGTITSNGDLCLMTTSSDDETEGTYSLAEMTFKSPSCYSADIEYPFEQIGNTLIIRYLCIEPCQAKYKRE